MHVDVVAVLVVFSIAITVNLSESSNRHLSQMHHGRRHKHDDRHVAKLNEYPRENTSHRKRGKHNPLLRGSGTPRHNHPKNSRTAKNNTEPVFVECCPTLSRKVEMFHGLSMQNTQLEILNNMTNRQIFHEILCAPGIENEPCRAVRQVSRCVQRYTYSYAIVRDWIPVAERSRASTSDWRLDHIRIPSGCSCEVQVFR